MLNASPLQRRRLLALGALAGLAPLARAAAPAHRIISIGGALTELIYALGAQEQLVGVDGTSLYPAAATKLPHVGYARTLAAEGLLSLAPTLIVATEEAGPPPVLRQLEAARVPLHVLRSDYRFEGVVERGLRLGELLGHPAEAQALLARLKAEWAGCQQQVAKLRAGHAAPRVLFVMSHAMNQVRIGGQDTGADAMIAYAGGANALQGFKGYKGLTPEAAIAAAPDVILATSQGLDTAGGVAGLLKVPGLAQTPAGAARRVIALETMELLGFGPRLPQAVARLAEQLHKAA
ncbi:ABC transporter substrate-binding protein [Roseateles sp. DAIF2]|uniref:heme/hemin ABC transporter substrate-binding protein n=1 Tax=Roseateles sp. DAIF2 TaxID=2714952 RepID=UPI0018A2C1C5|nr:ABC transporter substrate-binding protein [Roseateles sp. DAIF2]QPF75132.1 ABC transporter substrate-binding protein [Roseateles sp. DAIF2]